MKRFLLTFLILSGVLTALPAVADDLLGKKGGGSGGSGGSGGGNKGGGSGDRGGSGSGGTVQGGNRGGSSGGSGGSSGGSGNRGGGSGDVGLGKKGGSGSGGGSSSGDRGGSSGGNRGGGGISIGGGSSDRNNPPRGGGATIDRGNDPRGGGFSREGDLLGKRPDGASSRSGRVSYESSSNSRPNSGIRIDSIPQVNRGRLDRDVNNQNQVTRRSDYDREWRDKGYRDGYSHYNSNWRDSWFWYPHYRFRYDPYDCVPSPWYFYPHLPAYIQIGRVSIALRGGAIYAACRDNYSYVSISYNSGGWNSGGGSWYGGSGDWGWGNDSYRGRRGDLDYAIDDIIEGFRRGNVRPIGQMIDTRSRVLVEIENEVRYSMAGDDFYDLMEDLVSGTRTTGYRIDQVRTGRDQAMVMAVHEFRDTWGQFRRTRHYYGLEQDRRGFVIREFSIRRG